MSKKRYPIPEKIIFDDAPIGSIIGWEEDIKDSEPLAIPEEYAEMNGQTINDPESPLNGITLPDWSTSVKIVDNIDYTGTALNLYPHIRFDNLSANRNFYFPNPQDYPIGHKVKISNNSDGTYKVILNRYGTTYINVYSGNEVWDLTTFELLQSGDWCEFLCDGTNWIKCNEPYWHYVDDPATGFKLDKTTNWTTADSFSGGVEVTFTELPLGTISTKLTARIYDSVSVGSKIYWRKSGDTNVSNTPEASDERAYQLIYVYGAGEYGIYQTEVGLSSDLKVQFASKFNVTDLSISYPYAYLQ